MATESIGKKIELAWLCAFYGGMLTEKQRRVMSLHCEEDLSLAEIADEVGISRQAVHDTITRTATKLTDMENSLGVAARFRRMQAGLAACRQALEEHAYEKAGHLLDEMIRQEQEESDGI